MTYIGIGPEQGKRVYEEDAFGYALDRCTTDCADDFCKEFGGVQLITVEDMQDFRRDVVEWFYSGNWYADEGRCGYAQTI